MSFHIIVNQKSEAPGVVTEGSFPGMNILFPISTAILHKFILVDELPIIYCFSIGRVSGVGTGDSEFLTINRNGIPIGKS